MTDPAIPEEELIVVNEEAYVDAPTSKEAPEPAVIVFVVAQDAFPEVCLCK